MKTEIVVITKEELAQMIKNSGLIPFFQIGKTILFDKAKVIEAMKQQGKAK